MTSLLFAMVASFLAAIGARDQLMVAALSERLQASLALLLVALACATDTALLAAWFGERLSHDMSADGSTMFVAIALLCAAIECAWPNRFRKPQEPTRSLGALAIVLFARQLTDASRFLIVAFAVIFASPALAGIGGALGGGAAVALGWGLGGELERRVPLRLIRIVLAIVLFPIACVVGLTARGLI